ncbi:MAG: hypothetical protein MRY57_00195 [Candidatus Pacebacteria bacterium]|nr:hypothetical protein [Candidatus Paceibacterota bacterium]
MTEFLKEIFKDRVTHPFYKTYAVTWFVVNWKIVYSLFFTSEEYIYLKYNDLRHEYFFKEFFNLNIFENYYFWVFVIILPILFTWLIIWKFPDWIFIKATIKNEKFRVDKKIARIEEEKRLEEDKEELIKVKKENIKEEVRVDKLVRENKPEIEWDKEYVKFTKTKWYKIFNQVIESAYSYNGRIIEYGWNQSVEFEMNRNLLAYVHSKNIVTIDQHAGQANTINLTEKGKYFVSRYTEDSGGMSFNSLPVSA